MEKMGENGNRMLTPEEQDELRRKDAADAHRNALRADVMGSLVKNDPSSPGYLGTMDHLLTAHGAVETMGPDREDDSIVKNRLTYDNPPDQGARAEMRAPGFDVLSRMKAPTSAPAADSGESLPPESMGAPALMKGSASGAAATPTAIPGEGRSEMASPLMGAPQKRPILGRIGDTLARMGKTAGNIAGNLFVPEVMALTPGTELNKHLGEIRAQKTAERQAAETSKENLESAQADEARARAESLRHPQSKEGQTPEEVTIHDLMAGDNGQPRINPQTQKPYTYLEAYQAVQQAKQDVKPEKPEKKSFEEETYDEWRKTHPNGTRLQFEKEQKQSTQPPERPQRQLAVTPDGKVIEVTAGMTLPPGTKSLGGELTLTAKTEQGEEAGKSAVQYANDYMAGKQFTGPGDEALMEKFFEMAKPSSGFRMTQAQIEMLQHARDLMGSLEAKAKHLFTPDAPWFSDTQRKQIVKTMNDLGKSRAEVKPGAGGQGGGGATKAGAGGAGGVKVIRDANGRITGVE